MNLIAATAGLGAFVLLFATAGRLLIRRSAPALMRIPRAAVAILGTALAVWLLTVGAIALLLASGLSGPQLVPGRVGEVCQRCLDAASPLPTGASIETAVPGILLLMVPVVLLGAVAASLIHTRWKTHLAARQTCLSLRGLAQKTTLLSQPVTLVDVPEKVAFALPRRSCGIAISQALVDELTEEELQAVLAHEAAHLNQRHHLIAGLIEGATRPLLWVPLVRAVADAVPHYLEMAADNHASKQAGTPALASALLKLGETPVMTPRAQHVVLHAAGIDRIRHLVSPPSAAKGLAPAALILLTMTGLLIVSTTIHLPYLQAVIAGCFR